MCGICGIFDSPRDSAARRPSGPDRRSSFVEAGVARRCWRLADIDPECHARTLSRIIQPVPTMAKDCGL